MRKRNDTVQNFAARQCCLLGHPVSWTNCFDQCWTASHNWAIFFLTENSFFNACFDDLFMKSHIGIIWKLMKNFVKSQEHQRKKNAHSEIIWPHCAPALLQVFPAESSLSSLLMLKNTMWFFFENAQILTQFVVERVQYS